MQLDAFLSFRKQDDRDLCRVCIVGIHSKSWIPLQQPVSKNKFCNRKGKHALYQTGTQMFIFAASSWNSNCDWSVVCAQFQILAYPSFEILSLIQFWCSIFSSKQHLFCWVSANEKKSSEFCVWTRNAQ